MGCVLACAWLAGRVYRAAPPDLRRFSLAPLSCHSLPSLPSLPFFPSFPSFRLRSLPSELAIFYPSRRGTDRSISSFCPSQITALFACPNIPPPTGGPQPTLAHFIAYTLHRTRLPEPVNVASLLLLSRLKARFPAARGSSGHRLFISAFMM